MAIDVSDLTQLTCIQQLFHVAHGRVKEKGMACHDNEIARGGDFPQFINFRDLGRQWLFDENALAREQRLFGDPEVRSRGCGNDDTPNFRIREDRGARIHCGGTRKVGFDKGTSLRTGIDNVFDPAIRQGGEIPKKIRTPITTTNLRKNRTVRVQTARASSVVFVRGMSRNGTEVGVRA